MPFASTRVDRSSLSEPPDQEMTCPRRCPCTCARRCTANYTLVRYAQLLRLYHLKTAALRHAACRRRRGPIPTAIRVAILQKPRTASQSVAAAAAAPLASVTAATSSPPTSLGRASHAHVHAHARARAHVPRALLWRLIPTHTNPPSVLTVLVFKIRRVPRRFVKRRASPSRRCGH